MAKDNGGETLIHARERLERDNPDLRESLRKFIEDRQKYIETVGKRRLTGQRAKRAKFQAR